MLSIKSRKNSLISLRIIFFWWILVFGFDNIHSLSADAVTAGDVLYNTHGKRDPFVPLVSVRSSSVAGELLSVEKAEDVRLEGLVYDPQKGSIAILNGTVVAQGREVGSVKVLKIDPNGVLLTVNGTEYYKLLYEESKGRHAN